MRILLVGGGGREHAIVKKLKENPKVDSILCLPGNGGIEKDAQCESISAIDIPAIVEKAKEYKPDLCVISPDDPLILGCADALRDAGFLCFGPGELAARIEGSKEFAKRLMEKMHIPTAKYAAFSDLDEALEYLKAQEAPIVIKADGPALGKGVTVAQTISEAESAVRACLSGERFGDSGKRVLIEECLSGPEVSVLALTDGKILLPFPSSMDHKRAFDGDRGPNTGGMGVIAPNPFYNEEIAARCMKEIFLPTLAGMREMGCPFAGCLYFGLMLTKDGPKVIEYNCRFGDPETQAVLPLMESDLLSAMLAVAKGDLSGYEMKLSDKASCCVMIASNGYPGAYEKGKEIAFGSAQEMENVTVYHSGTKRSNGRLVTAGGRVLGVTATGETLSLARERAYAAAREISFEGAFYRTDI